MIEQCLSRSKFFVVRKRKERDEAHVHVALRRNTRVIRLIRHRFPDKTGDHHLGSATRKHETGADVYNRVFGKAVGPCHRHRGSVGILSLPPFPLPLSSFSPIGNCGHHGSVRSARRLSYMEISRASPPNLPPGYTRISCRARVYTRVSEEPNHRPITFISGSGHVKAGLTIYRPSLRPIGVHLRIFPPVFSMGMLPSTGTFAPLMRR